MEIYNLQYTLSSTLHPLISDELNSFVQRRLEENRDIIKARHIRKFNALHESQVRKRNNYTQDKQVVYNFSSTILDPIVLKVLPNGFNCAVPPASIPIERYYYEC